MEWATGGDPAPFAKRMGLNGFRIVRGTLRQFDYGGTMTVYFDDFTSWNSVAERFAGYCWSEDKSAAKKIAKPEEVIFASYEIDGYEGSAAVLFRNGDKYYTVEGSHCSCFGLEDQWNPEEYDLPVLIDNIEKRGWGIFERHKKNLLRKLRTRL